MPVVGRVVDRGSRALCAAYYVFRAGVHGEEFGTGGGVLGGVCTEVSAFGARWLGREEGEHVSKGSRKERSLVGAVLTDVGISGMYFDKLVESVHCESSTIDPRSGSETKLQQVKTYGLADPKYPIRISAAHQLKSNNRILVPRDVGRGGIEKWR